MILFFYFYYFIEPERATERGSARLDHGGALIRQRLDRADVDRMLELRDGVATRHLVRDTVVLG